MMIDISSPDDERISAYLAVRERDLVGRQNRFIAEGEVVLNVLLRSDYAVESLLISQKQLAFVERMPAALLEKTPVYVAEQQVMDAIVGFHIHRGLLAVGVKPPEPDASSLLASLPANALVLGLVGLSNHDNIGGIFRNAAAFGVDAIIMDELCCDPLYRKALRVSVGGVLKVPFCRVAHAETMISLLRENNFLTLALSPNGSTNLKSVSVDGKTALLLGAEGPGLPEAILQAVTSISIPMANSFDSLNVATTSGIALYQMQRPNQG